MRKFILALMAVVLAAWLGSSGTRATAPEPSSARHSAASRAVAPRAIGGSLRFLDPPFSGTVPDLSAFGIDITGLPAFDLGDALPGERLERIVHVAGGLKPYTITSAALDSILVANGEDPTDPDFLTLNSAGVLSGIYQDLAGTAPLELFFDVRVTDAAGTALSGIFRLNIVDSFDFRFARDTTLASAQLGLNYQEKIETFGSFFPPVRMNVVAGSITFGGAPVNTLEELGLTLNPDGTLYGRPLQVGTLSFTVHAEDLFGDVALDFTGLADDQGYSVVIEDMTQASSTLFIRSMIIHGGLAARGRDGFFVKALSDLGGQTLADLAGTPLTVRIGGGGENRLGRSAGATFQGIMDGAGRVRNTQLDVDDLDGDGDIDEVLYRLRARIGAGGGVFIRVNSVNLFQALNADTLLLTADPRVIVNISFGRMLSAEAVSVNRRVGLRSYRLLYRGGRSPGSGLPLAGFCQLTKAHGADFGRFVGNRGDNWYLLFAAAPRFGIDGSDLQSASSATLRLGRDYDSGSPADTVSNPFHEASLTLKTKGLLRKFQGAPLNSTRIFQYQLNVQTFRHSVVTFRIQEARTGLPVARGRLLPDVLQFEIETGSLRGAASRPIFPFRGLWLERP